MQQASATPRSSRDRWPDAPGSAGDATVVIAVATLTEVDSMCIRSPCADNENGRDQKRVGDFQFPTRLRPRPLNAVEALAYRARSAQARPGLATLERATDFRLMLETRRR